MALLIVIKTVARDWFNEVKAMIWQWIRHIVASIVPSETAAVSKTEVDTSIAPATDMVGHKLDPSKVSVAESGVGSDANIAPAKEIVNGNVAALHEAPPTVDNMMSVIAGGEQAKKLRSMSTIKKNRCAKMSS